MSTTHHELTESVGYRKQDAWLLTTQIVAKIFTDLASVRSLRMINPSSPKAQNTARVLIASMKTHELMAEYVSNEIGNHPSVASEHVKFLATHAGFAKEANLCTSVKPVEEKASKAAEDGKHATQLAKSTQGDIEPLKKEVARISAKVP
jgi:hypothetical protein